MFNTSPVLVDVNAKVPAIEALPVPEKALIVGDVKVLFVKVSVPASVANDPSCNALLNSAVVPVTVLSPKSIVLLVKVCVEVNSVIALAVSYTHLTLPTTLSV